MTAQAIPYYDVSLSDGFWQRKQHMVSRVTIPAILDRFTQTGRLAAYRFEWRPGMPNEPHIFWQSDIDKWIEAASYVLEYDPQPELKAQLEQLVAAAQAHQEPSGYLNCHFTAVEPDQEWQQRSAHELYTAGHMIEAAVAYTHATGDERFLQCACRFADHIEQVFVRDHAAAFETPGHEEIELALVKLYTCTGNNRYLDLSRHFIDRRGQNPAAEGADTYVQDHLPVREQTQAVGHAVRAGYLYTAMADLARLDGDETLWDACETLFRNITERRMYITGGIGSTSRGEAFTIDYDLPNLTAYSETCAAISLAMFASRLSLLHTDSRYADTVERALYNGVLSGISLDGRAFFYENPLEINPVLLATGERLPATQRKAVFDCSCCPPNIARTIASIGGYVYHLADGCLCIDQYVAGTVRFPMDGRTVTLTQETRYPLDGMVNIRHDGVAPLRLALRIPGWCRHVSLDVDGQTVSPRVEAGYAYLEAPAGAAVRWRMDMEPQFVEANPQVSQDCGRCAVQYGPIVYCAEAVDNGPLLRDIRLLPGGPIRVEEEAALGMNVLYVQGVRRQAAAFDGLYRPRVAEDACPQEVRLIPYCAFANRGESAMLVWFQIAD